MRRYQLVMFDMDGTFMSSRDFHTKVFHRFLNKYVCTIGEAEVRSKMGDTVRNIFDHVGIPEGEMELYFQKLDEFCQAGIDDLVLEIPVSEGIHEALDEFHAAGAATALVTNSMQFVAMRMLTLHGLAERFDAVSGADAHSIDKMLRAGNVAAGFGVDKENIVYIGDTEGDIRLARALGCDACFAKTPISWYRDETYIREQLCPEYTITTFRELPRTIGVYVD